MVRIIVAQRPLFVLTYPVFHPSFCLPNIHLPHSNSFFESNTCVIEPYISLSTTMPDTFYHLINTVVKAQTLPFASSIADLLNDMCPLGNISDFLFVF